jgi:hypothetical protein
MAASLRCPWDKLYYKGSTLDYDKFIAGSWNGSRGWEAVRQNGLVANLGPTHENPNSQELTPLTEKGS